MLVDVDEEEGVDEESKIEDTDDADSNNDTGKRSLVGWGKRGMDKNSEMYVTLFQLAYQMDIHKVVHGKSKEMWMAFTDALFQQPCFANVSRRITYVAVQRQYKRRIDIFKTDYGWSNGGGANISDKDGDLVEPDCTIRKILEESDQFKAEQDLLKSEKAEKTEQLGANEVTILLRSFGMESKKKQRNYKTLVPQNSAHSTALAPDSAAKPTMGGTTPLANSGANSSYNTASSNINVDRNMSISNGNNSSSRLLFTPPQDVLKRTRGSSEDGGGALNSRIADLSQRSANPSQFHISIDFLADTLSRLNQKKRKIEDNNSDDLDLERNKKSKSAIDKDDPLYYTVVKEQIVIYLQKKFFLHFAYDRADLERMEEDPTAFVIRNPSEVDTSTAEFFGFLLFEAAQIVFPSIMDPTFSSLHEIGFEMLIQVFCTSRKNFDFDFTVNTYKVLGIGYFNLRLKLYYFFFNTMNKAMNEKEQQKLDDLIEEGRNMVGSNVDSSKFYFNLPANSSSIK